MTKKEARGMLARIIGTVLVMSGSGLAGWTGIVKAGEKRDEQRRENTVAVADLKATHKEDMKSTCTQIESMNASIQEDIKETSQRVERLNDSLQEMKIKQAETTVALKANTKIADKMDGKIDLILQRLPR